MVEGVCKQIPIQRVRCICHHAKPKKVIQGGHVGSPEQNTETVNPPKLGTIIQWFKTMITIKNSMIDSYYKSIIKRY